MKIDREQSPFRSGAEVLAAKLLLEGIEPDDVVVYEDGVPNINPARDNFGDAFADAFKESVETHVYTKGNGDGPDATHILEIYNARCEEEHKKEMIKQRKEEKRLRLEKHRGRQNCPASLGKYSARNRVITGGRRARRRKTGAANLEERIDRARENMWRNN